MIPSRHPAAHLLTALLTLLLAACAAAPPPPTPLPQTSPEPAPQAARTLHILHTNDFHGQILPRKATWINREAPPEIGGAHALAGYIDKARADAGAENVLLLDSGDIFAGTPEGDMTGGLFVVDLFNALRFDAMALGNHEFDRGPDVLAAIRERAQFPILAANLTFKPESGLKQVEPFATPTAILQRGDLQIGLIGVIAPDTPIMTHRFAAQAFDFAQPQEAIERAAADLRARGVDLILILSHVGIEGEKILADNAPQGVVAVLGGHSHTGLEEPYVSPKSGVIYMQTWAKGSGVDHLTLQLDPGAPPRVLRAALVPLMTAEWPEHPAVQQIAARYTPAIDQVMNEPLGACPAGLATPRGATASSPLGAFLTEVMREAVGADVAITNKTGIRAEIPPGDVTMRTVHNVSPFGNNLVQVQLTGAQLRALLEFAAKEKSTNLEVSGVEVVYDLQKPPGERLRSLKRLGKPLKDDASLTVVTNSFLAGGGDGHATFTQGAQRPTDQIDAQVIAAWFRKHKACPTRPRLDVTAQGEVRVAP